MATKCRERGAIVNVFSNLVAAARLHNGVYAAAKEGLLGLTKVLAIELAAHRVRVNTLSPDSTHTELMNTYDDEMREGILRGSIEKYRIGILSKPRPEPVHPQGRTPPKWGLLGDPWHPTDHAGVVAFLVSDAASHIAGQNLFTDGGRTLA